MFPLAALCGVIARCPRAREISDGLASPGDGIFTASVLGLVINKLVAVVFLQCLSCLMADFPFELFVTNESIISAIQFKYLT